MKNIKYYAGPAGVKDALAILLDKKYKAMAVAGGTLAAKTMPDTVETFLDLKNLPIKGIKLRGGNLVIGAGATFDYIDRSDLCRGWAGGAVSKAAAACSSQLIRNMATIGGNIARPHSFNIFPVVLLGLDAKVVLRRKAGPKTVSFGEFYSVSPALRPGLDCLITEIVIPSAAKNWKCEFIKLARTGSSWESYITLFLAAGGAGKALTSARVAVGAIGPRPLRAIATEKAILTDIASAGRTFTAELEAAGVGEQSGKRRQRNGHRVYGRRVLGLVAERYHGWRQQKARPHAGQAGNYRDRDSRESHPPAPASPRLPPARPALKQGSRPLPYPASLKAAFQRLFFKRFNAFFQDVGQAQYIHVHKPPHYG